LISAVPVPFHADGSIDTSSQRAYARWLADEPVDGVAVWAHTGRGLRLSESQRAYVLECWRETLSPPRFVVAAAGAPHELVDPDQVIVAARSMARQAFNAGADALLVHPPVAFRQHSNQEAMVLEYHAAVADVGLPLILFYLYEAAGGISYSPDLLRRLLALPRVLGIKVATLDSVMTFQDIARLIETAAPGKVLVTGEDRFLGYSLMCGAESALIGMAAACTRLQAEFLESYWNGESRRFLSLNRAVDDLAQHTFAPPMEGYILRMLRCLVRESVIPPEAAHDPWGPDLDARDARNLDDCLDRVLGPQAASAVGGE